MPAKLKAALDRLRPFLLRARRIFLDHLLPRLSRLARFILPPALSGLLVFVFLLAAGLGDAIGENLAPLTGAVPAALLVFGISFIPVISPLTGPGMAVILAAGILAGEQIAAGAVNPLFALPLFFAIDARLGGGFVPRGLAFGEDEKETLEAGIPGVVFTRLILLPAAVAASFFFTFGF